ncbi:DUF971 domain-containing protein [Azospirillum sp. ST 5-10]|uniref:DUF971 domain-containing protein n=1 Tax=unclassified Azospirillum TaxID=2630922 RepID=UPI003F49E805
MQEDGGAPLEVRLTTRRDALEIAWADGRRSRLDAATLRAHCPSAGATRLRLAGLAVPPPDGLTIASVAPVGRYALTVGFSDGHRRGIYPWPLLRAMGGGA